MPHRPGVDDNQTLQALIDVWRKAADSIDQRLAQVFARIRRELAGEVINRNTIQRLRAQADRLDGLAVQIERQMARLTEATTEWAATGLRDIYAAGAGVTAVATGVPFAFTAPHVAAMEALSADLFGDVLTATRFVTTDAKRFARRVGRELSVVKVGTGVPVKAGARDLASELADGFERRGMGAVVYRDGSRHSFGEYAEMLLRTKTGVAYNSGTTNHARALGIQFYELLDGSMCGLTSHNDPMLANGLIVDADTAASWPLAHPGCRRAINPRPDLTPDNVGEAVSVQAPESRADQAAFERALAAQQQARAGRRERRQRRARV